MRMPHYLPRNKANQMPANCIWFDTETKPTIDDAGDEHHHLWFGYAAFRRRRNDLHWCAPEWLRFETIAQFWDWVIDHCRERTRLYLFCHQGQFDLPVMDAFSELPNRGFGLKNAIVECPPMVLTWKRGRQTIRFVDTLNIWRQPLQKIGEHAGLAKLPMPADTAPQCDWDEYGRRDTEIIMAACLKWWDFLRENDLGGFAPTLAAQAFTAYRHRFMATPLFIDDKIEALELSRKGYLGGRCECFRLGAYRGQFTHLDINSMYPAVMAAEQYPVALVGIYHYRQPAQLAADLDRFCIVAEVDIETRTPVYPQYLDGKLTFPIGRLRVTLSSPELRYALEHNHLRKIHAMAVYTKGRPFAEFVAFFYAERLKAKARCDTLAVWFLKILANSLYGKFGQRGRRYETHEHIDDLSIKVWTEVNAQTRKKRHFRRFGGLVQHWTDEGESRHSHPAIAAHVTAHARIKLWRLIQRAGRKNVYYCDTDSVVVNELGRARLSALLDENELGALKLEAAYESITLYGPKDYQFGNKRVTKGVRKTAIWLDNSRVSQDRFIGFKGLLRRGSLDAPIVQQQIKVLKREYTKGRPQKDGRVLPLIVSDW